MRRCKTTVERGVRSAGTASERHRACRLREHCRARIESDDLAAEVSGQEPCAAGDVERPCRRNRTDERRQACQLLLPAGSGTPCSEAPTEIPAVVLASAAFGVLAHVPRVRPVLPLESVPNFSEGRDQATIDAIGAALASHARLLDVHADVDHNRSVFTLVGSEEELPRGADRGCCRRARNGSICGATTVRIHGSASADVVPLVPIRPSDLERAQRLARALGERIGALGLPVFLYAPPGRGPAFYRRGGAAELERRLASRELVPDFGPPALDPAAGAVIVGARSPLIAFNVNLRAPLDVAREIAAVVRESGGGFPGVRALGFDLREAGLVQVSMNVEDWQAAPLAEIVGRIADARWSGAGERSPDLSSLA